jgi:hypothetical protein
MVWPRLNTRAITPLAGSLAFLLAVFALVVGPAVVSAQEAAGPAKEKASGTKGKAPSDPEAPGTKQPSKPPAKTKEAPATGAKKPATKKAPATDAKKPVTKKAPATKEKKAPATKEKATKKARTKEQRAEPPRLKGIDASAVWRTETDVFAPGQLAKLEPILHRSTCRNEKTGCLYHEDGRAASEDWYAFRLIPWKVSSHRAYLVRNDRCGAGGCDEGLFVLIDGQWRLLVETFGILNRTPSSTLGFSDLTFRPRGRAPVRLAWDGQGYREVTAASD